MKKLKPRASLHEIGEAIQTIDRCVSDALAAVDSRDAAKARKELQVAAAMVGWVAVSLDDLAPGACPKIIAAIEKFRTENPELASRLDDLNRTGGV